MDLNAILELSRAVRENGLTKLEIQEGELKILIERSGIVERVTENISNINRTLPEDFSTAKTMEIDAVSEKDESAFLQKAPLVGVLYLAPESGAAPFVSVGDRISKGDVLCLIEAMKMYNELRAEVDGVIGEILVSNETMVEFGQPLFKIV